MWSFTLLHKNKQGKVKISCKLGTIHVDGKKENIWRRTWDSYARPPSHKNRLMIVPGSWHAIFPPLNASHPVLFHCYIPVCATVHSNSTDRAHERFPLQSLSIGSGEKARKSTYPYQRRKIRVVGTGTWSEGLIQVTAIDLHSRMPFILPHLSPHLGTPPPNSMDWLQVSGHSFSSTFYYQSIHPRYHTNTTLFTSHIGKDKLEYIEPVHQLCCRGKAVFSLQTLSPLGFFPIKIVHRKAQLG